MKLKQSITAVFCLPILLGLSLGLLVQSAHGDEPASADKPTEAEVSADIPPQPSRSTFDIKEFDSFISHELSRTQPRGSHAEFGPFPRQIHGQVVDHAGQPIVDAFVALVERIGYSSATFNESYDKTDKLGRFVVAGQVNQERIIVRRSVSSTWKVWLQPKQSSVKITWPKPATIDLSIAQELRQPEARVLIRTTSYWSGMTSLDCSVELDEDGKSTVTNMIPGDYFVSITKEIEFDEGNKTRYIDIGGFSIKAGERKKVHCQKTGKRQVTGQLKPDKQPRF